MKLYSDDHWNECDDGTCEAREGETGITICIYCGGELREVAGMWYHWTQFDINGNLIKGSDPQDIVKIKTNE